MQHEPSLNFFGKFLVKRGYVSNEVLDHALKRMNKVNKALGEMACESRIMTPEQAKDIHETQQASDKLFGQIALQRGYINQRQLLELLNMQMENHLFLGEALLQSGRLEPTVFVQALNEYSRLQQAMERHNSDMLACAEDNQCLLGILDAVEAAFRRFPRLPVKMGGLCQSAGEIEHEHSFLVSLELLDGKTVSFSITLPRNITASLHSLPEGAEVMESDAVIVDAVWQLVDVVKRYVRTRLSHTGFMVHETRARYFPAMETERALLGFMLLRMDTPAGPFILGYRVDPRDSSPFASEAWAEEEF